MTPKQRIQKLLTAKPERSIDHLADELTRQAARVAWARETSNALREAWRERDDRCTEAAARLSEEEFELWFEAEQVGPRSSVRGTEGEAQVDAIFAQVRAVADHDRWPRHLYFGCV